MSRISNFFGQPKEIELEFNGKKETFKIHPLKGKHLHLFMGMTENSAAEEKEKLAHLIVLESLKPTEPELTLEEIQDLPVNILNKILLECMELNGEGEDERLKSIKEQIRQKQQTSGNT